MAHPTDVSLIDLNAHVCPAGHFEAKIDGVVARSDGVHFTVKGSRILMRWLVPQLEAVARAHPRRPQPAAPPQ